MKRTAIAAVCVLALSGCSSSESTPREVESSSTVGTAGDACDLIAEYESTHASRTSAAKEIDGMQEVVSGLDAATRDLPSDEVQELRSYMRAVAQRAAVDEDPAATGAEMAESQTNYYIRLKEVGEACAAAGSPIY